ncbi:tetratricopeptide repeat protein [Phormidesmis priestleyi ULC007]|uniref:Tetratricopeptide repeat protein n=1 Tax=Phormidesmis priestleyi ULC007 TaxID=1920490 RepID=A0A2T1DIR9_9CYAN|nr:tetratricopeptide repeat-containing serine protease family protein [Phormidesmis priestleyi]PSB20376.1 tetratricopeptide repeat protein [Phormidesmis priestleyi ULC007]PZO52953.1 MAG: tetratricopeptide repeat protein [Phormidesmis priestleyi]
MKLLAKTVTVLNSVAIALGVTHLAFALDPVTIYQRSSPAVAVIAAPNGKSFNLGSGVVLNPKGLILTSQHVVGNNRQVWIKLADGSVYQGTVVSRNPNVDLAMIQIQPKKPLPSLKIQAVPPQIGQKVYAIGNPSPKTTGTLERSFSDGIVSRIDGNGLIQFTASVTFGSSGGPLLNEDGYVVGIVKSGTPGTNFSFAVPVGAMNALPGRRSTAGVQAQHISYYVTVGLLQLRQNNFQKASQVFSAGIQRYPNNPTLYTNRGITRRFLRDYQGALEDFARSIQLRPTSTAYFNRAALYESELKQPQQAIKDYSEAIRINQGWGSTITFGDAFYRRGRLQDQQGNKKAAIADFKQAAKLYSQLGNQERYRSALDQITLLTAQ